MSHKYHCLSFLSFLCIPLLAPAAHAAGPWAVSSPDGKLVAEIHRETDGWFIQMQRNNEAAVPASPIGITFEKAGLLPGSRVVSHAETRRVDETYLMPVGKRSHCRNRANELTLTFAKDGQPDFRLIVRAYAEGIAYRYCLDGTGQEKVLDETSSVRVPRQAKGWFARYVSHYESFYTEHDSLDGIDYHIQVPALFQVSAHTWIMLSEADVDGNYCGSRLRVTDLEQGRLTYTLDHPPTVALPASTPWRVAFVVDDLRQLVESTLITNLGKPCAIADTSWIKPGTAIFPWLTGPNTNNSDPKIMKQFIDLASELQWPWIEFDNAWITLGQGPEPEKWMSIGWIPDVVKYAATKGVNVYGWDQWKNLDTPEKRDKVLGWLQQNGFKGIKVDFLDSDSQERYQLRGILARECAKRRMLISYHGDVTPRGMERTWPNIATCEGVAGEEYYLGYPQGPSPTYDVNLVFTRNVAGSMDYTPTTFDLPGATATSRRISTSTHEMALAVVFESGWQSMGVNPNSMRDNPAAKFLTGMPAAWDDVRLVDGRPGEFAVVARRKGSDWWLAGINAEKPVELKLSLDFIRPGVYATTLFKDQDAELASGLEFVITNNGGINAVVSWIELWSTAKPAVEVPWQRPAAMEPAPAGYHLLVADNCGTAAGRKHLVSATGDDYTWGPNDVPPDVLPAGDPARSLHFSAKELKYRFPRLDKSQNYILRVLYSNNHEARTQSLSCNGRELHGPLQLPARKVLCRSFKISGNEMRPLPGPEPLDTKIVAEPVQLDTTKPWTIKVPARGGFGLILRNSNLSEQGN